MLLWDTLPPNLTVTDMLQDYYAIVYAANRNGEGETTLLNIYMRLAFILFV